MQALFSFPSAGIALDYYPTEMSASLLIPKSPRLWHLLYGLVILSSSANLILPVFVVKHMNGFLCYQSSSVPIPADPISNCLWAPSHLVILTDLWNSPASCFSPGFFCVFFFFNFFYFTVMQSSLLLVFQGRSVSIWFTVTSCHLWANSSIW